MYARSALILPREVWTLAGVGAAVVLYASMKNVSASRIPAGAIKDCKAAAQELSENNPTKAAALYERAIHGRGVSDPFHFFEIYMRLAEVHRALDNPTLEQSLLQAKASLEQAIRTAPAARCGRRGCHELLGVVLSDLASAYEGKGDVQSAVRMYDDAARAFIARATPPMLSALPAGLIPPTLSLSSDAPGSAQPWLGSLTSAASGAQVALTPAESHAAPASMEAQSERSKAPRYDTREQFIRVSLAGVLYNGACMAIEQGWLTHAALWAAGSVQFMELALAALQTAPRSTPLQRARSSACSEEPCDRADGQSTWSQLFSSKARLHEYNDPAQLSDALRAAQSLQMDILRAQAHASTISPATSPDRS